jgi:hypothetical protein
MKTLAELKKDWLARRYVREMAKIHEREAHAKYHFESTLLWAKHHREQVKRAYVNGLNLITGETVGQVTSTIVLQAEANADVVTLTQGKAE